jgi:hypothetical protein
MHLSFNNPAIMTRVFVGAPVTVLVAITNTGKSLPVERVLQNALSGLDFLGPSFGHSHAAEDNAFMFDHGCLLFQARSTAAMPEQSEEAAAVGGGSR